VTSGPATVFGAVDYGGPWELPPVGELFNFPYFPGTENWGPLALNRTAVFLLLSSVILSAVFLSAASGAKVVPGRFQGAIESLVEFIRERIAIEIIGPEGRKYVPLLTTFFVFL
jgi:F-type H+-transporting ATPase subunit a